MKKIFLTLLLGLVAWPMTAQESVIIQDAIPSMPRTTRVCNYYYVGDTVFKKAGYEKYLQQTCLPAYFVFHKGRQMATAGWTLFGTGVAGALASFPLLLSTASYLSPATRLALGLPSPTSTQAIVSFRVGFGIALASIAVGGTGVVLLSLGYDRQHGAANIYNASLTPKAPSYWTLSTSTDGVGVAYNF